MAGNRSHGVNPSYSFHVRSDGTIAFDHHCENGLNRTIFDVATARNLLVMLERAVREAEAKQVPEIGQGMEA